MREGTSGVWVTYENNKLEIGYEDYGVSLFGGGDFECVYKLDEENSKKFIQLLSKTYNGSVKEMVVLAFGETFSDSEFVNFCKKNNIEYNKSTWTS